LTLNRRDTNQNTRDELGYLVSGINRMRSNLSLDISRRKQAEERLKRSEERYRQLYQNANEAIYFAQDGKIVFLNPMTTELLGYASSDIMEKPFAEFIHPDDREMVIGRHERRIKGEDIQNNYLFRIIQRDDTVRWVVLNAVLVEWEGKSATLNFLSDTTERKKAEEKIQASLNEKETLLQEIHHRVKNNMQIISSLLKLQGSSIDDEQAKDALKESQSRIFAMSAVHETLYGSENLSEINLKQYINTVSRALIQTYLPDPNRVKLSIDSDDIKIDIRIASPIGLIINELVSNSLKHAFPGDKDGKIDIIMKIHNGMLTITVSDSGGGMQDGVDWKNVGTLGLKLVCTLVEKQLAGSISLENQNGTTFIIKFNIHNQP
jgi:PAS domain S-box-containing protein